MYFDNKSIVKAALMSFGLITANLIVEFIMIFFGLMPEDALLAIMMQVIVRIVTGCVGLALMKRFYVASLNEFFTNKIPKIVWVIMIPLYLSVIARLSRTKETSISGIGGSSRRKRIHAKSSAQDMNATTTPSTFSR